MSGGFHRPHSGAARVALRTGALVIPVGIGVQRDRIRVTEIDRDSSNVIGRLYASGPYAMTAGRLLTFEGDVQDRERVRAAAGQIMHHIRNLARDSERRIRPAQAPVAVPQPSAISVKALWRGVLEVTRMLDLFLNGMTTYGPLVLRLAMLPGAVG